jgi:hypothetical protein
MDHAAINTMQQGSADERCHYRQVSHLLTRGDSKMTRRDWELLDKQLWGVSSPPPQNGAKIGLTIIAVFLAGIGIGDILFAPQSQPILTHDAVSVASNAQSIMR